MNAIHLCELAARSLLLLPVVTGIWLYLAPPAPSRE